MKQILMVSSEAVPYINEKLGVELKYKIMKKQ